MNRPTYAIPALLAAAALAGCGGGAGATQTPQLAANAPAATPSTGPSAAPSTGPSTAPSTGPSAAPSAGPSVAPSTGPSAAPVMTAPPASAQLQLPAGFAASVVANVSHARELAALPNGDLLVGTSGSTIVIVRAAEAAGIAQPPLPFATLSDDNAASVAVGPDGNVYAGTDHGVWRIGYTSGATSAGSVTRIAAVRTGPVAPNSDGDLHSTTSVAATGSALYAGVGSSCNACSEIDPTRASVQQMALDGSGLTTKAKNYRNALALAVEPATGAVWAGGAGQDTLPAGHPYETLDAITSHPGVVNYGWPACYDDNVTVAGAPAGACDGVTLPALVFPAYATLIGATFYPSSASGTYAFPALYRGGMFVTMHGSWHTIAGASAVQPQVVFVPFASGLPKSAVTWSDPTTQWQPFFENFGATASARIGRPTGIAVGAQGSLFVADDLAGNIYRIRPATAAAQMLRHR